MKEVLIETSILDFRDFRKKFILDTEAVLLQKNDNGNKHVIAYGSHAMNNHE